MTAAIAVCIMVLIIIAFILIMTWGDGECENEKMPLTGGFIMGILAVIAVMGLVP